MFPSLSFYVECWRLAFKKCRVDAERRRVILSEAKRNRTA